MKGLLLAGGHGTRLRPLTFTGNKHMLPIANQPMLLYGLRHLQDAGIRDVGIVLGPIREGIEDVIGTGAALGLRVTYIEQGPPKGLAHAVACAREFLGDDPFVMYLGDNLLQAGVRPLTEAFAQAPGDAVIAVTRVADPRPYGVVELDGDRIVSIEEKPARPRSSLALVGIYLFTPAIHPIIADLRPSARGELEITEAIWRLHLAGGRVRVRHVTGWWKDTGRPDDLLAVNELVLRTAPPEFFAREGSIDPAAEIVGSVALGAGSSIAAGARVEGPAVLGRDVVVGPGSVVGPAIALGDGARILGARVDRSIVMDRARILGPIHLSRSILGRDVVVEGDRPWPEPISCVLGDAAVVRIPAGPAPASPTTGRGVADRP